METSTLELTEVYGIWPTSFWQTWLWYGILGIGGVSILVGAYVLIVRYNALRNRFPAPLLAALTNMGKVHYATLKEYDSAYSKLTAILKRYMQALYKDIPQGATDEELLMYLKQKSHKEAYDRMSDLIRHAQTVKFAHQEIAQKNIRDDIMYAISFIKKYSHID